MFALASCLCHQCLWSCFFGGTLYIHTRRRNLAALLAWMLRSWCASSWQQSFAMSNPYVFGDIRVASAKTTGISLDVSLSFGGDSPTPFAAFGCFIPFSTGA